MVDLFSKRQKRLRGDVPDVYTYTELPEPLRVQVIHIWVSALGGPNEYHRDSVHTVYESIVETLCREYGCFTLPGTRGYGSRDYQEELFEFLLKEKEIERVLDAVELSFRRIDRITRRYDYLFRPDAPTIADGAIRELNARFKEHGVGYEFTNGEIVRIDSEFIHSEVVKPALRLLNQGQYAGAQEEFLKAHEHYRKGNAKEALNECLKAFESTMKGICEKRGWSYSKTGQAKDLIQACMENGLIPAFWQSSFNSLRTLLESSVPTGRNKLSGHGQGTAPVTVPEYLVSYMLHMTAAAIVFLAEAEDALA
ncbi:MAG: hypothetical protein K0R39_325 [Symbiobacteriaceae bacterium]|nr:hypothetical protein [Symbiobacteriaceae bacterium]